MFGIDDVAIGMTAAAAIGGGSSLLGGLFGGESAEDAAAESAYQNRQAQKEQFLYNRALMNQANQFSAQQSQINRDWQEQMSNSAFQRQKADLVAAGYNPLLAVGSGGASTPAGSAAHGASSSVGSYQNPVSQKGDILASSIANAGANTANTALQAIRTFNDADLNNARKGMLESSKALADIQKDFSVSDANMRTVDNAARFEAMTGVQNSGVNSVLNASGVSRERFNALVDMYKEQIRVGKYMPALNAIGETVGIVKDSVSAYQGIKGKPAPVVNKTTNFYQ